LIMSMTVTVIDIVIIWMVCRFLDHLIHLLISHHRDKKLKMSNKVKNALNDLISSKDHDVEMTVQCVACKAKKVLKASEGPHKDIPLCPKDGMPMLPVRALVRKKGL